VTLGLRPLTPLRIDNSFLRATLDASHAGSRIFTSTIARSQLAWQFTREWSLRVILQYDETAADPLATTIAPRRNLNADVLVTRLVNPWTALCIGYDGNAGDRVLAAGPDGVRLVRAGALSTDAWQVFVKWSHLLRW
jgi:hypothetical protein